LAIRPVDQEADWSIIWAKLFSGQGAKSTAAHQSKVEKKF